MKTSQLLIIWPILKKSVALNLLERKKTARAEWAA
ncbi:hypothetical protein EDC30_10210 [Paucimonas lemoignei]|uniref:Uncharacterized protein n=1 Tax=Paucimonas lemoignei TaxID=29443 RepID=A0A4R3I117_PAULE|nr:hypothetical protein EDC30_10210 [Paucimonas lemoignei]